MRQTQGALDLDTASIRTRRFSVIQGVGLGGTSLEQLVDDWFRVRRRQGNAPGTEVGYGWALKRFTSFLSSQGVTKAHQLEAEDIEAFQDLLIAEGKARQSQRLASTAIRELLMWAAGRRLVSPELHLVVARVRVPRGLAKPLAEQDLNRLLVYLLPQRPRASVLEARDRALFLYLLGSTARVSEVLQMTRRDFEAPVVQMKGGREHRLFAPPVVMDALRQYLVRRGEDEVPWMWITYDSNRPRRRLTPEGVRAIWKRLAPKVGVADFPTHRLRHTAATVLLDRRVQESVIAAQMGHVDLSTVLNYARLRPGRRLEATDALGDYIQEVASDLREEPLEESGSGAGLR